MDFAKLKHRRKEPGTGKITKIIGIVFSLIAVLVIFIILSVTAGIKGRTNIVLVDDAVNILSLDNEQQTLVIVKLPESTYLNVARNKGQITAGSLFKFDRMSQYNGRLLTETIREYLGIPVDGWIKVSSNSFSNLPDFQKIQQQELSFLDLRSIISEITGWKTNVPFLSLRRFYFQLQKVRPDKITFIDLATSNLLEKETLPDNSVVLKTDQLSLDSFLKEKFFEWAIRKENLTIAVLNSTTTIGLGAKAARIITNSGGHVVIVEDSPFGAASCQISVSDAFAKSYTVSRLAKIFSCLINNNLPENARSDILINLGSTYEKEINGP